MSNDLLSGLINLPANPNEVQIELQTFYDNDCNDLLRMISLICETQYHKQQKSKLSTSYILSFINRKIKDNIENDDNVFLQNYWKSIQMLLKSENLKLPEKKLLYRCIITTLNRSTIEDLQMIFSSISFLLMHQNQEIKRAGLLIIQGIIEIDSDQKQTQAIIQNLFVGSRQFGLQILKEVLQLIKNVNQTINDQTFSIEKQLQQVLTRKLDLLYQWIKIYEMFLKQIHSSNSQLIDQIFKAEVEEPDLLFIIDSVYSLRINLPVQPDIIISLNKLYFDNILNKIKTRAFGIHNTVLENNKVSNHFIRPNRPPYLQKIKQHLSEAIKSISYAFKKFIDSMSSQMTELIKTMLYFVFLCMKCRDVFEHIHNNYASIFYQIIVEGLKIKQEQIEEYNENPDSFISTADDLVKGDGAESIKSIIRNILLVYVQNIGCGLSFITYLSVGAIKKKLGLDVNFVVLQQFQKTVKDYSIETFFVILSILAQRLANRKDLLKEIDQLVSLKQTSKFQDIDLCRFYHFVSFCDKITVDDNLIKIVQRAATDLKDKNNLALSYFCYDLILQCIRKNLVSAQIWNQVTNQVQQSNNKYFFEFIDEVLENNLEKMSEEMVLILIQKLLERIQKQYKKSSNGELSQSMNYSWNTINKLCQNTEYLLNHPPVIQAVKPLLGLMFNINNVIYPSMVFDTLSSILKTKESYQELQFSYLSHIDKYFHQSRQLNIIFQSLSLLLTRGESYIRSNPQILETISFQLEIAVADYLNGGLNLENIAQGLMLFQIVVYQYGDIYKEYQYLHNAILFYLEHQQLRNSQKQRILKSKLINLWALSSFYSPLFQPKQIYDIAINNIDLYDIKVFMCALERIFKANSQYVDFYSDPKSQVFHYLLNFVTSSITRIETNSSSISHIFRSANEQLVERIQSRFKDINVIQICQNIVAEVKFNESKYGDLINSLGISKQRIAKMLKFKLLDGKENISLRAYGGTIGK